MKRAVPLTLFFLSLIFLHAMAMSENTDNTTEDNVVYGFSPDRSRWSNYAMDFDDTKYYYDTKSIVKRHNYVKVWIKFGEPVNEKTSERIYKEATALKEINCGARLIKSLEWNYISMKNEYKTYASSTRWENIEPETVDDALLEAVCARVGSRR